MPHTHIPQHLTYLPLQQGQGKGEVGEAISQSTET